MADRLRSIAKKWIPPALLAMGALAGHAAAPPAAECKRVVMEGDVKAGQEWKAQLGEGWQFRVAPIQPQSAGYSGWDLIVDRVPPAGFPDALLLVTLPYNSINEREIGTTFGLRAQDAIGWNPRSFHFLTDAAAFRDSQQIFRNLMLSGAFVSAGQNGVHPAADSSRAMAQLMALQQRASSGEFRIVDARIVPGVGDAAPYAEGWSLASARTPHQAEGAPSGKSTSSGTLNWIRFEITLWLPGQWRLPSDLRGASAPCPR